MAVLAPALLLFAPLAGCQRVEQLYNSKLTADTPVDWWHQLEGGAIAEDRPPPPGASAPYPNLDQVPGQAPSVDSAAQRTLEAQLLAERDQVRRNVVQDPLSASPPNQPVAPPPLPSDPDASRVVADAASATPGSSPAAPAPAPQAAPAAAPAAAAPAAPSSPAPTRAPSKAAASKAPAGTPPATAASASAPPPSGLPTVPDAPPALPQLAGIDASLVPAASRPPPPGVAISFRRGSAEVPLGAVGALQALAARRAGGAIAVSGGGDSGPSPAAQAAALPLALRRANAVLNELVALGVPAGDVHATALATARGTRADLIQSP
ncbi:MAG: hypothetical protein JO157_18790 [Acetobacteraceae bacterium]|nr:hypothetical protein [Acetobacteraceae bacterium]